MSKRNFLLVTREGSYMHSSGRVLIPIDKIIQIEETDSLYKKSVSVLKDSISSNNIKINKLKKR